MRHDWLAVSWFALIMRGVAFEFRGKDRAPAWRRLWDRSIFFGSLVPAVLWGVAWGNILRGVPVDPQRIGSSPACSTVPQ